MNTIRPKTLGALLALGLALRTAAALAQTGPLPPGANPVPMDQQGVRDAAELMDLCRNGAKPGDLTGEDRERAARCKGYMVAFFQYEQANPPLSASQRMCLTGEISFNQIAEMLRTYGTARPELHAVPADQVLRAALQAHYPCPEPPGG